MELQKPVFLIGFMASGKTTLGHAVAAALPGITFVDLDEAVEAEEGCTVAQSGTIVRRLLEADPDKRPLVKACMGSPELLKQKVEQMMSERSRHYGRAPYTFDADRLDDEQQVADAVERFHKLYLQ